MDTSKRPFAPRLDWLQPLGGWEAAARWNQMALEWMTTGWQQWLQLVTVWPAMGAVRDVAVTAAGATLEPATAPPEHMPAPAGTQDARNARAMQAAAPRPHPEMGAAAHAAARGTRRQASGKRASRPQASSRSPRSRG